MYIQPSVSISVMPYGCGMELGVRKAGGASKGPGTEGQSENSVFETGLLGHYEGTHMKIG